MSLCLDVGSLNKALDLPLIQGRSQGALHKIVALYRMIQIHIKGTL